MYPNGITIQRPPVQASQRGPYRLAMTNKNLPALLGIDELQQLASVGGCCALLA